MRIYGGLVEVWPGEILSGLEFYDTSITVHGSKKDIEIADCFFHECLISYQKETNDAP